VATDPGFYRATSVTTRESNADVMASMIMPCLLIVGELDPRLAQVRQCASGLPNATFFGLPGCDHVASAYRSEPRSIPPFIVLDDSTTTPAAAATQNQTAGFR
jgi:hypothetical protein